MEREAFRVLPCQHVLSDTSRGFCLSRFFPFLLFPLLLTAGATTQQKSYYIFDKLVPRTSVAMGEFATFSYHNLYVKMVRKINFTHLVSSSQLLSSARMVSVSWLTVSLATFASVLLSRSKSRKK